MLNAVFSGKKRGTGLQNQQTALELAEGAEDVLTASVFERLAYLPDELSAAVLSELLGTPFGPLQAIEYWPSWYLQNGTRVEPDVLLQDAQHCVLIEAKRHDYVRQQNARQLANQLLAGWHGNYLGDSCILMTLGGLEDTGVAGRQRLLSEVLNFLPSGCPTRFSLVCRSWQQLYQALESQVDPDSPAGLHRLLDDIAKCYAWHGLRTHPMHELVDLRPPRLDVHPGVFAAWSRK
ncbi:F-box domain-containing protein [Pseudomonas aeruginosa]